MISSFPPLLIPVLCCVTTTCGLPTAPHSHAPGTRYTPRYQTQVVPSLCNWKFLFELYALFSLSQQEAGHSGRGVHGKIEAMGDHPVLFNSFTENFACVGPGLVAGRQQ